MGTLQYGKNLLTIGNSCYLNREAGTKPPLCDPSDDPDNIWCVNLKACISPLPENGYGANLTKWPARLHAPLDRLQSIKLDAFISRKELFKAESKYWNEIIANYVRALHWKNMRLRNVMDIKAGFGGFAAALIDENLDIWVMNVVPVSGPNNLPVIYDHGLIGVMHDWCEPFDTYPRTYNLLHAANLLSVEKKRCDMCINGPPEKKNLEEEACILLQTIGAHSVLAFTLSFNDCNLNFLVRMSDM